MRKKTDAKRDAILKVAAEVFREQGFERASMAAICARLGGSKSTLYSYFQSKVDLFVAVGIDCGQHQLHEAFESLSLSKEGLRGSLIRFGVGLVSFIIRTDAIAVHRMIIAEAGQSDIGHRFWAAGPQQGHEYLLEFMKKMMDKGLLQQRDPDIAALHLKALLTAETLIPSLYGLLPPTEEIAPYVQASVERSVDVFLAAYGSAAPEGTRPSGTPTQSPAT
jgi:AcrR family transcriptional regulator